MLSPYTYGVAQVLGSALLTQRTPSSKKALPFETKEQGLHQEDTVGLKLTRGECRALRHRYIVRTDRLRGC